MSAVFESDPALAPTRVLPLLADDDLRRTLVWRGGEAVSVERFLADVQHLASRLPDGRHAVNLCADRYRFLVAFCAVAVAGQTNLLPTSRAPRAVAEVLHAHADSYALADTEPEAAPPRLFVMPASPAGHAVSHEIPGIAADHVVAIGFTSGSTGVPGAHRKTWGGFCASSALNADLLCTGAQAPTIVATVPAQHMYGMETSVLLPLRSRAAVHAGQPFFAADIDQALRQIPAPRVLVTTPVHLRALLGEPISLPPLQAIVSATAPLDTELAAAAEARYATQVIEVFGSTETCVIAHRRSASEASWRLYPGIDLRPQPDGTVVQAAHLPAPTLLQDIVELLPARNFILRGRNGDLLEIAGKRASLGELTHRLLAVDGVVDGVVFQLDPDAAGVRRLAALAVAPDLTRSQILDALRESIDAVFLPRRLCRLEALPRNATGKLPRHALLQALRDAPSERG